MKLVIVHNHFRPGGVRRIIELATPHLTAALRPAVDEVIMVGGEPPDAKWGAFFSAELGSVRVTWSTEPALGYYSELPVAARTRERLPRLARRVQAHLERALRNAIAEDCVVWAHNQGLGRNLLVTRALSQLCAARGIPLIFHHHDWWFDNRWARWPEMRQSGFRTLAEIACTILPANPNVRHATINQADARLLREHFGSQAGWVPNLSEPGATPPRARITAARRWLAARVGANTPVWLVPCRLLRRKNLAEALLLTRWLRPEAWLVTTGGPSSSDEHEYAVALAEAAQRQGWPLELGVLSKDESAAPSVAELTAASEVVLLTSLQEGFGLPNLEAAAARRPLIARKLPNVSPDLARFGFRFPQLYDEVLVDPRLFDRAAEAKRQMQRWRRWRAALPAACRPPASESPRLLVTTRSAGVPFSRLTLTAQLEVLAHDPKMSRAACAPLNPWLAAWRKRAASGSLQVSPWPASAAQWLSGPAYARGWLELLEAAPEPRQDRQRPGPTRGPAERTMDEFIRSKLGRENQYPLLWTSRA